MLNLQSSVEIPKVFFSYCDYLKNPSKVVNINIIKNKIAEWLTNQNCNLILNQEINFDNLIIQAAKELEIKIGYFGKDKVPHFAINYTSLPFKLRTWQANDEKRINYFYHFHPQINKIKLLNDTLHKHKIQNWRRKLYFPIEEDGIKYNCYIDDCRLFIESRDFMWGLKSSDFNDSYTSINASSYSYLKSLGWIVKNGEDFIMEIEEKTLLKV